MKKLLLTGAGGFLGCRAAAFFKAERYTLLSPTHGELDITDSAAVARMMADFAPDFVLHCAAISDTWQAEQNPETSYAINVQGTVNLASACAKTGAKLVYISSDQVYNGCRQPGPLAETLSPAPANVYGRQKLAAEQAVTALLPTAVGLRLTWLYDLPTSPYTPNRGLLLNLQNAAAEGKKVAAPLHEHRGITDVWAVVRRLPACFSLPGGVYNFGCENPLASPDTYRAAARLMGLPEEMILPDANRFADAPRNLAMNTARLAAAGITFPQTVPGFAEALAETMQDLYNGRQYRGLQRG